MVHLHDCDYRLIVIQALVWVFSRSNKITPGYFCQLTSSSCRAWSFDILVHGPVSPPLPTQKKSLFTDQNVSCTQLMQAQLWITLVTLSNQWTSDLSIDLKLWLDRPHFHFSFHKNKFQTNLAVYQCISPRIDFTLEKVK